jgi:hypothetical protein
LKTLLKSPLRIEKNPPIRRGGQNTKKSTNTPSLFNKHNTTTLLENMNIHREKTHNLSIEYKVTHITQTIIKTLIKQIKTNNSLHRMGKILESVHRDIPIENTPNIIDPHIEK